MKNILIATDLTANSAHALDRAMLIAQSTGAKLHILHVASAFRHPGMKDELENSEKHNARKIEELISDNAIAKNLAISIHIANGGRVHERVNEYAKKLAADLIIMGIHEEIEYISAVISTTLERVIFTGSCPVLLVTTETRQHYNKIILGPNLSVNPEAAIKILMKFCTGIHLVLLLKTNDSLSSGKAYFGQCIRKIREKRLTRKREKFLETTENLLRQNQQSHMLEPKYMETINANVIREEAHKFKADMIALDMRGRIAPKHLKIDGFVGV